MDRAVPAVWFTTGVDRGVERAGGAGGAGGDVRLIGAAGCGVGGSGCANRWVGVSEGSGFVEAGRQHTGTGSPTSRRLAAWAAASSMERRARFMARICWLTLAKGEANFTFRGGNTCISWMEFRTVNTQICKFHFCCLQAEASFAPFSFLGGTNIIFLGVGALWRFIVQLYCPDVSPRRFAESIL